MEYKKVMIDGIEYNCLTDEELEDLKIMIGIVKFGLACIKKNFF